MIVSIEEFYLYAFKISVTTDGLRANVTGYDSIKKKHMSMQLKIEFDMCFEIVLDIFSIMSVVLVDRSS